MATFFNGNVLVSVFLVSIAVVQCIPTSVLINSKASNIADDNKVPLVKRDSNTNPTAPVENDKPVDHLEEKKTSPQKRGVNSELYHRELPENNVYAADMSNGYWEDTDSGLVYPEIKKLEDYQPMPLSYRANNAYDNIQNILNGGNNGYEEPIALPVQYPMYPKYLSDRKKRSNKNRNLRYKDSNLTPAEMVALLELIDDRLMMDNSPLASNNLDFQNSPYELPGEEDNGQWWANAWQEPSVQYYGNGYNNFEIDPRYEDPVKEQGNFYPSKRYMIKKKRSLSSHDNKFGTERFFKPSGGGSSGGFDSRLTLSGAQKKHAKYF